MPHKTTRKIIKIGNTSEAIILPKSWLNYYDLHHGDRVTVITNGDVRITKIGGEPSGST